MSEDLKFKKDRLLKAAEKAVDELINVLNDTIIGNSDDDISADKMKNAAAAKRLAFEDALFILEKIYSANPDISVFSFFLPTFSCRY